jgi:hypothetical protein
MIALTEGYRTMHPRPPISGILVLALVALAQGACGDEDSSGSTSMNSSAWS